MTAGSLLHEVFRLFFEEHHRRPEKSRTRPATAVLIDDIAAEQIAAWREKIPPASELAFGQRREDILVACRTLLATRGGALPPDDAALFRGSLRPACAPRRARRSPAADPVAIPLGGRSVAFGCAARSTASTRRPTAPSTSGTTRPAAPAATRRGAASTAAARSSTRCMPWRSRSCSAAPGSPRRVARSGYFFPGRKGEGQRMPMALDVGQTRDGPRPPPRSAERGPLPARRLQGRLQVLRLRVRLRRRRRVRAARRREAREDDAARPRRLPGDP